MSQPAPSRSPSPAPPRAAAPVAALEGAVKRWGDVVALDGVDLTVEPGEVLALLGPNGAGKTTAVKLLLGLARADGGRAELFGGDPGALAQRRRVGTMLQISGVPETLKVGELLELFASYYPSPLPIAEALEAAGLVGLEKRTYGNLSGGQKQRTLFALALVGDPELLVLDEPTVGLDVASRRSLWERIRFLVRGGRSVLLTTHYLEEADALADRVAVLHRGEVIAVGSPDDIKRRTPGRRIRVATSLTPDEALTLPGATSARRDGPVLEILATEAEEAVRRLLDLDPGAADLEVGAAGLEEAFLVLTGEADRADGADGNDEVAA